ncbi:MAG TPA: DUF721 domain-containing protein [Actinomycetota bacterium]|nr:DUF721 domain-containing protein [Actinomycetota bacterium]
MSETSDWPTRLRDVLASMGGALGLDNPVETAKLWREWESVVGEDVARHARPSSLKRGVLRIRTDSPVWATELGYLTEHIRSEANRMFGHEVIRAIKVWTAPEAAPVKRSTSQATSPPPLQPRRRDENVSRDPVSALEGARRAWSRRPQ